MILIPRLTFIFVFLLLVVGCQRSETEAKKENTNNTNIVDTDPAYTKEAERLGAIFTTSLNDAKNNVNKGFLNLYEIYSGTNSPAEFSSEAGRELAGLLYTNTEAWIRALSTLDLKTFRFPGFGEPIEDNISFQQHKEMVGKKLSGFKTKNKKEQKLKDYILEKSIEK